MKSKSASTNLVNKQRTPTLKKKHTARLQREAAVPRLTYTSKELVAALGLSLPTVRKLIAEGTIKSVRAGARILVSKRSLDEYLAGR